MNIVTFMASTTAAAEEAAGSGSILSALGIDWKLLVVQAGAFLILVLLLGKFVYPPLLRMIESRRKAIEEGLSHARKADEALKKAKNEAGDIIRQARAEADEVIARSHTEAKGMIAEAETAASARAARIVDDAHAQLASDIEKAKKALREETVKLVAEATEQIIHHKLDAKKDESLIIQALSKERA